MNDRLRTAASGTGFSDTLPPIVDDVPPQPADVQPTRIINRTPPAKFAAGNGSNEIRSIRAGSREEAENAIHRQVRLGQTDIVYIYELVGAIIYEPSSKFIDPEAIEARLISTE
jgi:hypothetical protein